MTAARSVRVPLLAALGLSALAAASAGAQQSDTVPRTTRRAAEATIQPGDRIVLKVWREKTMSDTVLVDLNSQIVLPELGVFSVASQTVGSLPDSLRARYAVYLRNPSIDVTVLRRVGVLGEVKNPSLYWVDVTMSLPDVIAQAGGVTDIGNPRNVRIMRGGRATRISNWEQAGTVGTELLSGDQVIVGRSSWLSRNALTVVTGVGVFASIAFTLLRL